MRLFILILFIAISSCKKNLSTDPLNEMPSPQATVVASGDFVNGPYGTVMGSAKVLKTPTNAYEVVLDSFMTSNGPDLYVYLSQEVMPVNFIEAGKLRSTNGRQVYMLSALPDLSQYRYIAIHCKQYNHLFGYATLK
jgi:hypothetical protein